MNAGPRCAKLTTEWAGGALVAAVSGWDGTEPGCLCRQRRDRENPSGRPLGRRLDLHRWVGFQQRRGRRCRGGRWTLARLGSLGSDHPGLGSRLVIEHPERAKPAMPTALIIGSGPGAAGAALALTADPPAGHRRSTWGARSNRISGRRWIGSRPLRRGRGRRPMSSASVTSRYRSHVEYFRRSEPTDPIFPSVTSGSWKGSSRIGPANPSVVSGAYGGFLERLGRPDHALLQANVRSVADHLDRDGAPLPASPWVR